MRRKLLFTFLIAAVLVVASAGVLTWCGMSDLLGKADVALVLGNQVNPDGSPSARLKARLDAAVVLFRKGHFQTILVSGATGKEGVPEGTAMKRYLVASGIPDSAVIVDDQGVDTYASAQNTAAMLQSRQWKSVFVITQFYHVPRSKLALSKFGISPIYHAHARYFEARDIYSIMREIPAYLSYLLRPAQEK